MIRPPRRRLANRLQCLSVLLVARSPTGGGAGPPCPAVHRRRLITTPGVGPVVALTFRATVDVPSRFTSSKAVGAAFGLTPRRQQSGEIDRMGGISKCGDALMREMLFEAALVLMTHSRKWSWLKAWGMKVARHRGKKRAIVAVARRLAVIMHRMW